MKHVVPRDVFAACPVCGLRDGEHADECPEEGDHRDGGLLLEDVGRDLVDAAGGALRGPRKEKVEA